MTRLLRSSSNSLVPNGRTALRASDISRTLLHVHRSAGPSSHGSLGFRGLSTVSSLPVRSRVRPSRRSALASRRAVSSGRPPGHRWRSMWHRPGCKWVTSTEDPKTAPRDRDCPGCQEDGYPYELSRRELAWERRFNEVRSMIHKDPYEFLFGMSNRRLRRFPWSGFPFEEPAWLRSTEQPVNSPQAAQSPAKASTNAAPGEPSSTQPPKVEKPLSQQMIVAARRAVGEDAHIKWKTTASQHDLHPSIAEPSGEIDPITMRRIPPTKTKLVDSVSQTSVTQAEPVAVKKWENVQSALAQCSAKDETSVATSLNQAVTKDAEVRPLQPLSDTERLINHLEATRRDLQATKSQLERSWAKEANLKDGALAAAAKEKSKANVDEALPTTPKELHAQRMRKRQQEAFSKWQELGRNDMAARHARSSIFAKVKPQAHMKMSEFFAHRRALVDSLEARKSGVASLSGMDDLLAQEIERQKAAMAVLESKRHRQHHSQSAPSPPEPTKPESIAPIVPAEGDLCTNVPQFLSTDRWYKKKAPHALKADEKSSYDLTTEIKKIYEERYGTIDEQHSQVQLQKASRNAEAEHGPNKVDHVYHDAADSNVEVFHDAWQTRQSRSSGPLNAIKPPKKGLQSSLDRMSNTSTQQIKLDRSVYQVLAYDPKTHHMYEARASSSFSPPTEERVLSVAEALMRLHLPARFLPYFAKLQGQGYEIVSAGKHVLVFKHLQPALAGDNTTTATTSSPASNPLDTTPAAPRPKRPNPIDGTQPSYPTPQTGNFASPTGFVNHDIYEPPTPTPTPTPTSSPSPPQPKSTAAKVNKSEPVFSGSPAFHWAREPTTSEDSLSPHAYINRLRRRRTHSAHSSKPRRRRFARFLRALRRLALLGAWTAACVYATGVVIEYFRTGPRSRMVREGEAREWADTRGVGLRYSASRPITGSREE